MESMRQTQRQSRIRIKINYKHVQAKEELAHDITKRKYWTITSRKRTDVRLLELDAESL